MSHLLLGGRTLWGWVTATLLGVLGGAVNIVLSGGFVAPAWLMRNGRRMYDPGFWGALLVSAIAGLVAWGFSSAAVSFTSPTEVRSSILALLSGIGGAQTLRAYVEREVTQATLENLTDTVKNLSRRQGQ